MVEDILLEIWRCESTLEMLKADGMKSTDYRDLQWYMDVLNQLLQDGPAEREAILQ